MKNIAISILLLCCVMNAFGQSTNFTATRIRAEESLRVGATSSQKITGFDTSMPGSPTNTKLPTSKCVYDWVTGSVIMSGATASGDLSGTYPSPTVDGLQGFPISATTPMMGQVLKWTGSQWVPGTDDNTGTTYSAGTGIAISGGNVISNTGDTDASNDITNSTTAGGDLSGTYPNPTVDGLQGVSVSATTPSNGQVLKYNGTAWVPGTDDNTGTTYSAGTGIAISGGNVISNTGDTDASNDITNSTTAGGDLSGTYPNPTVDGLQGVSVSATTPSSGQVLKYNGTAWVPGTDDNTGTTYSAGTGIAISGGNVISNTGDLDPSNEINTAFGVSGSNLTITDADGTLSVPILNIAPVQSGDNSDFDFSAGVLSLDYTNAQKATGSIPGFLTAADWTTFNGKLTGNGAITGATKTKITYDTKGLVIAGADASTSDISEGSNQYFTSERAQDASLGALTDGTTIDFTYDDGAGTATAEVKAGTIGATQLSSTTVVPGTYGDATHTAQFIVDPDGRITTAANVVITGAGGGSDGNGIYDASGIMVDELEAVGGNGFAGGVLTSKLLNFSNTTLNSEGFPFFGLYSTDGVQEGSFGFYDDGGQLFSAQSSSGPDKVTVSFSPFGIQFVASNSSTTDNRFLIINPSSIYITGSSDQDLSNQSEVPNMNAVTQLSKFSRAQSYTAGLGGMSSSQHTIFMDLTSGSRTTPLPSAASADCFLTATGLGRVLVFKKTDSSVNTYTITADGSETIDGASSYVLSAPNEFVVIQSDGTNWQVIGK